MRMNKVARNASWIISCRIIQSVLAMLINMLTARFLGPSNYGVITYAASLTAFVLPIEQLGFNNILVQEIVNNPEDEGKILGTSMALGTLSSVCCIIGITGFVFFANADEKTTILVCILYSTNLIFRVLELIRYWFQAKYLSKYTAIVSLIAHVVISLYKFYLLATQKSIYWFAVSNAFDYAIISISCIIIYWKFNGRRFQFSKETGRYLFNRSKHYILSGMMVTIFAQTDKIMLKLMVDDSATGFYGTAVTCAGMTAFIFVALIDSFRPHIFEGKQESESVFEYRMTHLYAIIIYFALAQSVVITALSQYIIPILYGADYSPAIGVLRIIVWYSTFSYIGSVRNIWILANNLQRYLWVINIFGAAANVVLNAVLIPFIGMYGAAIASLITQIFTNVIVGYIIKPIRRNNDILMRSLNPKRLVEASKELFK